MAYYLQYDGTDDRVSVSSLSIGFANTKFTWVGSFDALAGSDRGLFQDWAGGISTSRLVCWYDNPNGLTFVIQEGGGGNSTQTSGITGLSTGVIYRVEVTVVNGSSVTIEVYNNDTNTLIDSDTQTHSFTYDSINEIFIGDSTTLPRPFDGGLYSFSVTEGGTETHFYDPSASNGTGSTLPDTTGANDGTLVNFPTDDSQWVFYSSGGTDALSADDIQSTSEVTAATLGQTHALTANDTESASQVSVPTLTEENTLAADDVQSVSEVTQPAIGQVHNLAANDAESGSEVTPATIGQEHALTSVDISSLSEVSQPTLSTAANVDALSANDVESSSEVTAATIAQVHAFTPDDVESASQTQAATITQIHALTATDAESATQVSSPTLRNPDEVLAQPINNTRATISQTQYRAAIQTTAYAADIIETNYRIEVA